jgi:hypothetical protein
LLPLFWNVLGAAVCLVLGAWIVRALVGGNKPFTVESVREAVLQLADEHPEQLGLIALVVVVLGALILARPIKMVVRIAAINALYEGKIPLRAARTFARESGNRGLASALVLTAGIDLLLIVGLLVPLVWSGTCSWDEAALPGALGILLLGLGALGLGAVGVEGKPPDEARRSALEVYFGSSPATLLSAAVNLVYGLLWYAVVLALIGAVWVLTCESLTWLGNANTNWVRWGLDGNLWPVAEGGLYPAASVVAGLWFVILFGCGLVYPLSYALYWGAACYLFARQQPEDVSPAGLQLSDDEQKALQAQRQQKKQTKDKMVNWIRENRPARG